MIALLAAPSLLRPAGSMTGASSRAGQSCTTIVASNTSTANRYILQPPAQSRSKTSANRAGAMLTQIPCAPEAPISLRFTTEKSSS